MKIDVKETKLTLAGLRIAETKLSKVVAGLSQKCAKDEERRISRLSKYDSLEEAHEAYGYCEITLDELHAIEDGMSETLETKYTVAYRAVKSCLVDISAEIRELEWDLLSQEDRDHIKADHENLQTRIAAKNGMEVNADER